MIRTPMIRTQVIRTVLISLVAVAAACSGPGSAQTAPFAAEVQQSGTESLLQAVAPIDASQVWVSGHDGVVLRTVDGGATWIQIPTPAEDSLQYRDVHAFSREAAVILSAGTGPASRIYRTEDAGASWDLTYLMEHEEGFLDCMDFWDERGFAYGDAVDGVPFILLTADGGRSWSRPAAASLPAAMEGEGGFAASGTCARAGGSGQGWIATGASGAGRVLRTADHGASWTGSDVPVVRGDAAGLTTVSFRQDSKVGVAFGGDLANMDGVTENAVESQDGGASWDPLPPPPLRGPVYGSTFVSSDSAVFVVGPAGANLSRDGGRSWIAIDTLSSWAVGSAGLDANWLVGPGGRILKVAIP